MWFGLLDFFLAPMNSWMSRKNEFAADAFAVQTVGNSADLKNALLKLRQSNHAMPLAHPAFSAMYYSHPPLLERLQELDRTSKA